MTHLSDDRLAAWLDEGPRQGRVAAADDIVAAVRSIRQRPAWLVALSGGTIAARPTGSQLRFSLVVTVAVLVGLLAAGVFVVGNLVPRPDPSPVLIPSAAPSTAVVPSADPSAEQSAQPSPVGLVAYSVMELVDPLPDTCSPPNRPWCHVERIWLANSDGTAARELLPDVPGNQHVVAWMPDGTRLLYAEDRGLAVTDASGSDPEIITATQCPAGTVTNCPNLGGSLSPDGTRLAYTLLPGSQADSSVVAVFDLATGQITLLESTRTNMVSNPCFGQGVNGSPLWSTDSTRLVVTRDGIAPLDDRGNCRSIVYTINADGSDFDVVVPSGARPQPSSAGWSPDGSWLLLSSIDSDPQGGSDATCDIAIVRPDGSDLRQLTDDGISCSTRWTRDGRILFDRWIDLEAGTYDLWIMDADGSNPRLVTDRSLAGLTAIGCVVCNAPFGPNHSDVLWQPTP